MPRCLAALIIYYRQQESFRLDMRPQIVKRLVRITGWVAISLSGVTALTPLANVAARAFEIPPTIKPASAIVVLGAGLNGDGELSNESLRRAVKGISLYTKRLAPVIVFSGPSSK